MFKLKPAVIRVVLEACVLSLLLTGCTACSTKTPRKHWWEFWKPKAPISTPVYPSEDVYAGAPGTTEAAKPGEVTGIPGGEYGIAPVRPPKEGVLGTSAALPTVYFAFDSYQLSPSEKEVLDRSAQWLQDNPTVMVQIEGHCDERGSPEYNLNLGQRRADAVREYLAGKGVEANRLVTISYGEERPADPGQDEKAWAMNRRAQFLTY